MFDVDAQLNVAFGKERTPERKAAEDRVNTFFLDYNVESNCVMKTVEVIVEHAVKNLSAYIEGAPVITVGNDMKELEDNMKEAIDLYLEDNSTPCEVLSREFELKFKIDAATFINYYSNIFTKAALSRITGINERQLWHYAAGVHKPRKQQLEKIQQGIQSLTKELSAINLL